MKLCIIPFIIILLMNPACSNKSPDIITTDLIRSDYTETIDVTGTIQAVNNITILAPVTSYTNLLQIVHLADDGVEVKKGDTICTFTVPELFNSLETYTADLEKLEADLRKLKVDNTIQLALLTAQIETNRAHIEITKLDSLKMTFATPSEKQLLALEMEKANIEKYKLQKKFNARVKINNSEISKLASRIMMQKSRIQKMQDEIKGLTIVSPVDGIATHVQNYRLVGNNLIMGEINKGSSTLSTMSVLQIPDLNLMQVVVEVPEADFKEINTGQNVLITVEAASNLQTTGKIKRKTLQKGNTQIRTAVKTYEVIIGVDSCHLKMTSGMSALCRIIVNQVMDTIVVPSVAVFVKDSTKIVYVRKGKKFTAVKVESGLSGSSFCIISKGLEGNETIALTQPSHNMIEKIKVRPDRTDVRDYKTKDTIAGKTMVMNYHLNRNRSDI